MGPMRVLSSQKAGVIDIRAHSIFNRACGAPRDLSSLVQLAGFVSFDAAWFQLCSSLSSAGTPAVSAAQSKSTGTDGRSPDTDVQETMPRNPFHLHTSRSLSCHGALVPGNISTLACMVLANWLNIF